LVLGFGPVLRFGPVLAILTVESIATIAPVARAPVVLPLPLAARVLPVPLPALLLLAAGLVVLLIILLNLGRVGGLLWRGLIAPGRFGERLGPLLTGPLQPRRFLLRLFLCCRDGRGRHLDLGKT
jgi:hypothetical protein